MISARVTVDVVDHGYEDLIERLRDEAAHVDIGVHSDESQELVVIAAANEFGATINHPGGTAYGYQTAEDARRGRVKFLKGGTGHKVLGVTGAHTINIPARSYIRSTVDENADLYQELAVGLLGQIVDGDTDKLQALSIMGQKIEADIKAKMTALRQPPNAPSTIRRKGSDNPLIDTGLLRSSIRYIVKTEDETAVEGD